MVKLIALDLDGTLLDPQGQITPGAKAAIAQARQAGVKVVLSTGRAVPEAADFSQRAGCDALSVCLGGAVLSENDSCRHLWRRDIPKESARRALELCLNREIELMLFCGEQIVLDPFSHESLMRTYPYPAFHDNAVVTPDPIAYLEEQGPAPDQDPRGLEPARLPAPGALRAGGGRAYLLQRPRF